ncbi:MAG TPA: sodium:calcium antiporter [Myxococcota bacterium]|jgi:cation:H+ antiporter|nr:sodium:calcium antiporter [Myxococcota bacterium]
MEPRENGPRRTRDLLWFMTAVLLPLPWIVAHNLAGLGLSPEVTAVLAGVAILGSAFLLSWATELAESDIPQSLALLVLALVSVLPEYAVDLHFAWRAGSDPTYAPYAVANMTGGNRLLIGLGWPLVGVIACMRSRATHLEVDPRQRLEIRFLLIATLYSFVIPFRDHITLVDAAALLGLFLAYVVFAMRSSSQEVELIGPAALLETLFSENGRRLWALAMFAFATYGILVSAEPFADGLVHVGRNYGIDEFLLVQWLAPLASESPEFVIAVLFALKGRGTLGIGALVSSKVNQWTLLVGAIPIAYSISSGTLRGIPLDARQVEELWLTSAQSLLATVLIADLRFGTREGVLLAVLFLAQLFFPSTHVRYFFIGTYLALSFLFLALGARARRSAFAALLRPSAGGQPVSE